MPVASSLQVSLSEVLQVKGAPLHEEELWSILCQSCKAIQDVSIQGRAIATDGPSFVVSPYTILFSPSGTVQFAESIDVTLPNIGNYLPPEGLGGQVSFSNVAVEKMYIYALGKSLLWASDYMRVPFSTAVLSATLKNVLLAMGDNNPMVRPSLIQILEACTIHGQSLGYGMPYARQVIQLSKIVLGSIFGLDQMADSFNSNTNNSVSTVTGSPMSRDRSPESRRSGRVSPGKRNHQQLNSSDSTDPKRNRTHDRDEVDARGASRKSRHRRNGYSHLSSSTMDSQDSNDDGHSYKENVARRSRRDSYETLKDRSKRADSSHKSNHSDGRSYHMSDIFSPAAGSPAKANSYQPLSEKSNGSRRTEGRHSRVSPSSRGYESLPDRSRSRSRQRSPPLKGRSSRTNLVYERLRERRERLGRLREQLGLRPRYHDDVQRSVSEYGSDTETCSEDDSHYDGQRSQARSFKSLTSMESARQGSYHPDQYSQYSSAASLPFDPRRHGSLPQQQSRSVPNVHQRGAGFSQYDGASNRAASLERRLQAPPSNEHKKNSMPSRKKLKKFFGPEFVVMSSEPNESITMPMSFLSKSGKIPPEKKRVTAVMLNGRRLDLLCDLGTSGQELFDLVASHIGLNERSYFGLAYIREGEYLFIDPDTKLYKVGPESWKEEAKKGSKKLGSKEKFTVFFRVKYYLENVGLLRDSVTRHQYYLQMRRDILEERTKCDEKAALQLAALALQAEMGDHETSASRNYFLPEHYVAADVIDTLGAAALRDQLPIMHQTQKGLADVDAEFEFLMEARKLAEYGIHFHRVTQSKKEASRGVWLGVCTRGIIVYEKRGNVRKQVHAHPWNKTKKIAFNRRKFIVEPYDETGMKFVHFTESYKKGRYLMQLCRAQHRFHMAMRSKAAVARQFQSEYPMDVDSYSMASGSTRYANHYELNDEVDYSDGEQSMLGSLPSEVGASSYTVNSMRHDGREEGRTQGHMSGYEKIRIGPQPSERDKSTERRGHPPRPTGHQHPPSPPYSGYPRGQGSNHVRSQKSHHHEGRPRDEYDGTHREENGYARVQRGQQRPHQGLQRTTEGQGSRHGSRQGSRDGLDDVDPPYATISSIKSNKEKAKQQKRESRSRREENGYEEIIPKEQEKPYVINTSLPSQSRTLSRRSLDQDESISASLRERLEDLPSPEQPERDIAIITLKKDAQKGLGLTIVGGENSRSLDLGIFVRSIQPQGPAHRDGRLHVGDRIISINGQSLEGVGHRVAVEIIQNAPEVVQLIVSQPKSVSGMKPKMASTPSAEIVYANVHETQHATPLARTIQSQGSLDNIQDLPNESSASDHTPRLRQKHFPPTKPRRRPESFGSNYSVNSDQERNGNGEGRRGQPPATDKPVVVKRNQKEEEDEEDGRKPTRREEGAAKITHEDAMSQQSDRDGPLSGDILDDNSADDWDDMDDDDDKASKVTTPDSSDMEDLFGDMDEKKNKPKLNFNKLGSQRDTSPVTTSASIVTAVSPWSDKPTSPMSGAVGESEVEKTEREDKKLDEEVGEASEGLELQPGDKYIVKLKKVKGSLGISVTGGVNTSVKHGGIYIKTMVTGGAADADGRIKSGDRLLEVNGQSLTQVTHKQAVEILRRATEISTLAIERGIPPAATTALPPTPVHFQQGVATEGAKQTDSPAPEGSGSQASLVRAATENSSKSIPSHRKEDLGADSLDYQDQKKEEEAGQPSIATEEPMVPAQTTQQQASSPMLVLPEIKVEEDADGGESLGSRSSEDVALSPTDLHRMDAPRYTAQRKASLGVIFHNHNDLDMALAGSLATLRRSSSAASLVVPSEQDSDGGESLMLPSMASHATTPTIEALQGDEYFSSPPLTEDEFGSENDMPNDSEGPYDDEESRPDSRRSVTESPFASDGYSDEVDDYLAEIASPTLSMREADTLTPTAHLMHKRKSWVSVASSHSPAPTQSTGFGLTEYSPRSSRRSPSSTLHNPPSESDQSDSYESGSLSFSDNEIAGHWSDEDDHQLVKTKAPVESTLKDLTHKARVTIQSPRSPEPTSESFPPQSTEVERGIDDTPSEPMESDDNREKIRSPMDGAANLDVPPPPVPAVSPPHSSRSPSPTPSQSSHREATSPTPMLRQEGDESAWMDSAGALTLTQTMLSTGYMSDIDVPILPYVTPENTFEVQLTKGSQGLGFSVMGGRGSHDDPRKCLISIKKIFAGQTAAQSGLVEEGDIILAVNGDFVHEATHPETVAKLRGAQQNVKLLLCRPSEEELLRLLRKSQESKNQEAESGQDGDQTLENVAANNNSQNSILSSPFSSPPLSPDPKTLSREDPPPFPTPQDKPSDTPQEEPSDALPQLPPPLPTTSPPPSGDEADVEPLSPDIEHSSPDIRPPVPDIEPPSDDKNEPMDDDNDQSVRSNTSSTMPKLTVVEIKSKIPVSTRRKSQDQGATGKPSPSPAPSTEGSPRKPALISEPSLDFDESEAIEVRLVKPPRGGLGFTVAGGANTGGCYIKDVLQEPATTDGRLKKGDRILEVNGRNMRGMNHFDAVSFLRMTPREVTIKVVHPSAKMTELTPSPTKPVAHSKPAGVQEEEVVVPQVVGEVHSSPALKAPKQMDDESIIDDDNDDDGTLNITASLGSPDHELPPARNVTGKPKFPKTSSVSFESDQIDSPGRDDLPTVVIKKNPKGQLGLLLGLETTDQGTGLFVKEVVTCLPMADDGSIRAGDQIHFINDEPVSRISMADAKSLLARVPSLVKLKATRNKIPVKQKPSTAASPTSTAEQTETDGERASHPSQEDEWMTDSSEPIREGAPAQAPPTTVGSKVGDRKKSSPTVPAFDLDLGDVSEADSDWEDFSATGEDDGEEEEEEPSRLDEVGDIMKNLERTHGGYTPRLSQDEESKSPVRSITSPSALKSPTSPTSLVSFSSPPLSPTSPQYLPSTTKSQTSQFALPSPSIPEELSDDDAFSSPLTPRDLSSPEKFDTSPQRSRHDSTELELDEDLARLPPLPKPAIQESSPRGSVSNARSPVGKFLRKVSSSGTRDSPIGSEFSTSVRIGTPTGRPPSAQGSETGNSMESGIVWIDLEKPVGGGLGFSVVGAEKGGKTGIFVKTVTPEGAAWKDGRLKVGDRLLQVNGQSLVGMTQSKVIQILRKCKGAVKLAVTSQLSRPASLIGTDTERRPSSDVNDRLTETDVDERDLSDVESYTESARDAGHQEPPPEQDTDSDIDSTADLPDDFDDLEIPEGQAQGQGPAKMSSSLLAAHRVGQALQNRKQQQQESDEDSLSWGSENSLPLDEESRRDDDSRAGPRGGDARATPSTKILEDITEAELARMPIVKPAVGGRYSGKGLRSCIAKIQKQIDKQDPAEEFKTLRQVKAIDNCEEAKKTRNKDKNRFRNVLPYDKTRVILEDSGPSDYINASHVRTPVGKDTYDYVACQGPLPNTTEDFWLMVWEQRADVIAMVTMDVENGKVKCHRYWPQSANSPIMVYDRIEVRLENYQLLANFSIRRMIMIDTETSEVHHVTQLNFTTWPDHSVPSSALPLLHFACHMRRIHDNRLPIVVHCSAGIGRTGTLITIDAILGLIDRDEEFNILSIVKSLRKQRQGMIQTKDQYIFCYKAAMEALKGIL